MNPIMWFLYTNSKYFYYNFEGKKVLCRIFLDIADWHNDGQDVVGALLHLDELLLLSHGGVNGGFEVFRPSTDEVAVKNIWKHTRLTSLSLLSC